MALSYTRLAKLELSKAHESLDSAGVLLENNKYANSISCAYYAMFHAAKAALTLKGTESRTHSGTVNRFGEIFVKSGLVEDFYGKAFSAAMEDRMVADYGVEARFSREDAKSTFEDAKGFVHKIERLSENL